MIRNLKALGLALVAVFAMSALSASSASAVDHFTNTLGAGKPALLTGTSHGHEFKITPNIASFGCTTSKFTGTAFDGSAEVTVDPEYTGTFNQTPHETHCNSSLGKITVDMNGCHYVLTGNTTGEDPPVVGKDATVWITCPGTNKISMTNTGTGVTITIPPQTPTKGGVVYTNLPNHAGGAAIEVHATITGITFECHPTFLCTLGGISHHSNDADYTGTLIATCYEDIDGLPTPVTEGKQIGCSVS
jgi:hypothetical protein